MAKHYKILMNPMTGKLGKSIEIRIDGDPITLAVPPDPNNRHYAEYLEWVAEGNTAEEQTVHPSPPFLVMEEN